MKKSPAAPRVSASPSPRVALSPGQQFSISSFWFAANLLWGALLMIVIPSQMKQLAPRHPAETQGLLLGIAAIPALVVPLLVGPLSDRCMSKWGRRRPYMTVGVAINVLGLTVVWAAGRYLNLILYFAGYFIVQIGNNIATGAYSGVIPDIVPERQRGEASGWMAAMSQLGTILGVLSAGVLMNARHVTAAFAVIAVSLILFLGITIVGVRERPRKHRPEPISLLDFLKRLWIDPRKHPDFAWVWITRALVVMGLWTVQEFMQFYLTDVVHVPESSKEIAAAKVLIVGFLCAAITGLIGGRISDKVGRKKVVYIANAAVAVTCFGFLLCHSLTLAMIVAGLFGLAYGAYYSVDWALACDVLPNKEDAAKDMAVWHISMVLPQTIILPISGMILGSFGRTVVNNVTHYTYAGYVAIFTLAAIFLILGAFFLRNVRGVR